MNYAVKAQSLRAMRYMDHGINESKVVFLLHTGSIGQGAPEPGYHNVLRGYDINALSLNSAGVEPVLRKSKFNVPHSTFTRTIVGPKSSAVLLTQGGVARPGNPPLR